MTPPSKLSWEPPRWTPGKDRAEPMQDLRQSEIPEPGLLATSARPLPLGPADSYLIWVVTEKAEIMLVYFNYLKGKKEILME